MATTATDTRNDELTDLLSYISHLALDDIDELLSRNATGSGDALNDEELALLVFAEEARGLLNIVKDHISAAPSGIADDVTTLLDQLVVMEDMARYDREMAIALSEGRDPPPRPVRARINASVVSHAEDPATPPPEEDVVTETAEEPTISQVASGPSPAIEPAEIIQRQCTACSEYTDSDFSVQLSCGHSYDDDCLNTMFRMATVDESAFPPSCCQAAIPLDSVRQLLDDNLVERFQRKSVEFTTTDRVYCYRLTCSTFLGGATSHPSSLGCPECRAETCSACKEGAHGSRPCSSHLNEAVLELAKERQWQRCPGCRHLVELALGCYHMQCICKKQFCYLCAATWKECSCPQFAEERLLL